MLTSAGTRRFLTSRLRLIGICAVALFAISGIAASSALALPKALIDESTVSGGAGSQEAKTAEKQGFEVTVISDAAWEATTQAEFGKYQVLIAGDPTCSTLPPGFIKSAATFAPVVLGLAGGRTAPGNKVLVGTDPVFHDGGDFESAGARGTIIREGIGFAGKQANRTGMYFDASCAGELGQGTSIVEILTLLTASPGSWTIDEAPPCGGNVSLIAANPSFSELTTASLEGWSCSVHESFPTYPTEWSALAVATDTTSHPTCGIDPGTGLSACGEAYLLIAGSGIVVKSEHIELTPGEATNPVGTDHTVTAHVSSAGLPVSGQTVTFSVTGQNAGASGTCVPASCMTDASGNVTFTYHDKNGAGEDTIKASFTDEKGELQTATALKRWVEEAPSECTTAKGTGHLGARGLEGINEDNELNTTLTGKEQFEVTFAAGGEHFHLTHLAKATCHLGSEPTFSGEGEGTLNKVKGYHVSFAFKNAGGRVFFTVVIEKGGVVVFELKEAMLKPAAREHLA
jgi:hypothetical protein